MPPGTPIRSRIALAVLSMANDMYTWSRDTDILFFQLHLSRTSPTISASKIELKKTISFLLII